LEGCEKSKVALAAWSRSPLRFQVGIGSGPAVAGSSGRAVAGVIGTSKFQYDLWGDTINTASRMESHGEPGRIQISESTYRLIETSFQCTPRGAIGIKGKGMPNTWFVEGRRGEDV
jgi:guanylate cyclase